MMPQLPVCLDLPIFSLLCLLAGWGSVAMADMAFQDAAVCWVA